MKTYGDHHTEKEVKEESTFDGDFREEDSSLVSNADCTSKSILDGYPVVDVYIADSKESSRFQQRVEERSQHGQRKRWFSQRQYRCDNLGRIGNFLHYMNFYSVHTKTCFTNLSIILFLQGKNKSYIY